MPVAFKLVEAIATHHQASNPSLTPQDFHDSERALAYEGLYERLRLPPMAQRMVPFGDHARVSQLYADLQMHPPMILGGALRLYNYDFFENDALPVNPLRREALIGHPLGWGRDYAQEYVEMHRLERALSSPLRGNRLLSVIRRPWRLQPLDKAVILSAPGHDIYGHWLIDMLPRLNMLERLAIGRKTPILLNFVPKWADYFLEAFGLSRKRIRPHPGRFFRVRKAIIPTSTKSGFDLSPEPMIAAWDKVLEHYARDPAPSDKRKIFLSRSRWPLREREFADRPLVDDIMRGHGYEVVFPETLSIREQIGLMHGARIIIGEDGSAMHNIVFARPGAAVGVLSLPERDNLYHVGICQIRKHRLAFCPLSADDDLDTVRARLGELVQALEKTASV